MLPNFLIIGAMKSGTTSLFEYLRSHPEVFMSRKKELDFFVDARSVERRQAWYEHQFEDADGALAIGEASTSYSKFPHYEGVPARIAATIPSVRLIYVIRNPIDRMRSHYAHELLLGYEHEPMEVALLRDRKYRDFSNYALQIEQYLPFFQREQLLIVKAEDLRTERATTLKGICDFLGVSAEWEVQTLDQEFHQTSEKRVPSPRVRAVVSSSPYRIISPLIPEVVKRFGRRCMEHGLNDEDGVMSAELRARLEGTVREDLLALRGYMDPAFDSWGLL